MRITNKNLEQYIASQGGDVETIFFTKREQGSKEFDILNSCFKEFSKAYLNEKGEPVIIKLDGEVVPLDTIGIEEVCQTESDIDDFIQVLRRSNEIRYRAVTRGRYPEGAKVTMSIMDDCFRELFDVEQKEVFDPKNDKDEYIQYVKNEACEYFTHCHIDNGTLKIDLNIPSIPTSDDQSLLIDFGQFNSFDEYCEVVDNIKDIKDTMSRVINIKRRRSREEEKER